MHVSHTYVHTFVMHSEGLALTFSQVTGGIPQGC